MATTDAVPGPCAVRFEIFLLESPKLGGLGCFQPRHFDPPSSSSRSCVIHESKGDPSTPWFLCPTFKSISSFTSAELMTASSKSGTNPVVRWLFPFIIGERGTFYSSPLPPKNAPWLSSKNLKDLKLRHGFLAEPVPVSAFIGSSQNLKDLKDLKDRISSPKDWKGQRVIGE